MRLFVAVEVDSTVVHKIAACSEELRRRAMASAPKARVTWVAPDRLHVTVRFIGQVEEPDGRAIAAALEPALGAAPFQIVFQGVGAFPDRGAPRVVWVGIASGAERMAGLEREVTARLESCGVPREQRPYRPHLTLARVREPSRLRAEVLVDALTNHHFGVSQVDAITLFESRPSPNGHVHLPIQRTRLGPALRT